VVTVILLKCRIYNASNDTSNALEPRSCNAPSGNSVGFETFKF
jgi:hypothetical protein